jgi:FAD/FMN-containing dehydrogenase
MKKVLHINKQHRMAVIEPGVTYGELAEALDAEGMVLAPCLAPRATKSVIGSLLELEPRLNVLHQWAYTDPLRCTEVTWGDGNRMYTGEAGGSEMNLEKQWQAEKWQVEPLGPMMLDFYRLLTGAQGTMGIVTWASVRCELKHQAHRSFFVAANTYAGLVDFVYKIIYNRFSDELFVLNAAQLASLIGRDTKEIEKLAASLPTWAALVGAGGRDLLPKERCEQQYLDMLDIAKGLGLSASDEVSGISAEKVMSTAKGICEGIYWKERPLGAFQDIFFTTPIDRTSAFIDKMFSMADEHGFPAKDIGVYVQPLHCGSAYHVEFTLYYDPGCGRGTQNAKAFFDFASKEFADMGAFYSRPYGKWAELQMNKDAMGKKCLDKLKNIFDPNGIMNPGKFCM